MFKTYNVSNGEIIGSSYRVNGHAFAGALSVQLKGDLLMMLISQNSGAQLFVYSLTSGNHTISFISITQ